MSADHPRRVDGTVLVVDDHQLVRDLLVSALRERGLAAHHCTATTIDEILTFANHFEPGLVLLDLDLGRDDQGRPVHGANAVASLVAHGWAVLVISGSADGGIQSAAAIAAGAVGRVCKSVPFETLVASVLDAAAGQPVMSGEERCSWLAQDRRNRTAARARSRLLCRLTPRELDVLDLLAEGHRAVTIADELVLSLTTVRSHIRSILLKLEVSSQLEAVALLRGRPERTTR
ncbi:MAG TPA: LuxR C-terminal-related transcriptional regulator [Pseudonocardia sp.]|nr:LuxR C-terminal-related transcriptional regulator [Pseudonocardia sp.]